MIKSAFQKYPLLMNSVFYGTLYSAAEFTQQTIQKKVLKRTVDTQYKWRNVMNFYIIGLFPIGSTFTLWYRWLDRKYPQITPRVILKKLILDQFACTPVVLSLFFVGMAILEGQKDLLHDLKTCMIPTFGKSCLFWLPAQTVNFLLVPPTFRVVYIATCAFFWANILCVVKRKDPCKMAEIEMPGSKNNLKVKSMEG